MKLIKFKLLNDELIFVIILFYVTAYLVVGIAGLILGWFALAITIFLFPAYIMIQLYMKMNKLKKENDKD